MSLQVQLLISAQDVENYKVIKSELDKLRTMVEKSELWVDKKGSSKGDSTVEGNKKEKKEVRALSKTLGTRAGGEWGAGVQFASVQHPPPLDGPLRRKVREAPVGCSYVPGFGEVQEGPWCCFCPLAACCRRRGHCSGREEQRELSDSQGGK